MSKRKSKLKAMKKNLVTQEELEQLIQDSQPILLNELKLNTKVMPAELADQQHGTDEDNNILLW